MAASEWTELDSLTRTISDLQTHQKAAKSVGSDDVAEKIEQEMVEMEERRNQLLEQLAEDAVNMGEQNENGATDHDVETETQRTEGLGIAWDRLTPADVQRARDEVNLRRTEMLERHAAELNALDADSAEVDAVDQAIATFIRKFGLPSAEIVPLNPERNSRQRTVS
jgi:hypothetical protein